MRIRPRRTAAFFLGLLFTASLRSAPVPVAASGHPSVASLDQLAAPCAPTAQTLCLGAGRFSAVVLWRAPGGNVTDSRALPITDNTGSFWFFDSTNLDLIVKVLDGRSINGKFWVFYGSLTNVEFTLTVTDTVTGAVKTYVNPQGQMASFADTSAF